LPDQRHLQITELSGHTAAYGDDQDDHHADDQAEQ
jgi:hypothetical protein